jgi:D-3-phosphoglycerate dehydrogenase
MKALILAPFSERALRRLRERMEVAYEPWTETQRLWDPGKLAERLRAEDVGVLIVEADFLLDPVFAVPNLKIAGACRNAPNQVDAAAATKHRVPVLNAPGRNNVAVAELAIGLMFALCRHVTRADAFVSAGRWTNPLADYERFRGRELSGSTVGVIGLGQIGREVAKRVSCLAARVLGADPFVTAARAKRAGVRLVSLRELLKRSDFVTLHTPATKETERMINRETLALMKPSAYLISTGAGHAVDLDALTEALRDGTIAGAGLDVFPGHLAPPSHPLLPLENAVLTPHMGGATRETVERHSQMMVDDIERFLRGERPRRLINPEVLSITAHAR